MTSADRQQYTITRQRSLQSRNKNFSFHYCSLLPPSVSSRLFSFPFLPSPLLHTNHSSRYFPLLPSAPLSLTHLTHSPPSLDLSQCLRPSPRLHQYVNLRPLRFLAIPLLSCHAMPCHAMPCHAIPCHAMPCHARAYTCVC
jgi:hypothetical protein